MSAPTDPGPPESLFRDAMSQFASGVTLVTTRGPDGTPYGFTASSFASLSLHPPLVLICLGHRAAAYPIFMQSPRMAISILNEDQVHLARLFSTRGADRFGDPAIVDSPLGLPIATGALAQIDCAIENRMPGGDHAVLFGRPLHIAMNSGRPLIHYDRTLRGI